MSSDPAAGFRHLGDTPVHQGHVWHVSVAEYEAPDGSTFRRDIVRSPGAVAVVPVVFDVEANPSVSELDLNPVFATEDGVEVVDASITIDDDATVRVDSEPVPSGGTTDD